MLKKNNAIGKITALLLILTLFTSLTACKKPAVADKDGAVKRYEMEEIEKEGYEGLFTLNEDGTFSILPNNVPGFSGATTEASPYRYLWYTDNGTSFTDLIPKVNNETPIVIIYNDDSSMPDKNSWYLERYVPVGATIGTHIFLEDDKTMYVSEENLLPGTSAAGAFSSGGRSRDVSHEIIEVSGSDVKLPIQNVDMDIEMLLGLTYGKMYRFKYLQGTKTKVVDITADAYAFKSAEIIQMTAPYLKTENGFFYINLPLGLEKGFYYISDMGFFYYTGVN